MTVIFNYRKMEKQTIFDLDELNGYRDLTEFDIFKNNKVII